MEQIHLLASFDETRVFADKPRRWLGESIA